MISLVPPTSKATTGIPQEIDSRQTVGRFSIRDGLINTSHAEYIAESIFGFDIKPEAKIY